MFSSRSEEGGMPKNHSLLIDRYEEVVFAENVDVPGPCSHSPMASVLRSARHKTQVVCLHSNWSGLYVLHIMHVCLRRHVYMR